MDRLEKFQREKQMPPFLTLNLFSSNELAGQFNEGRDKEEMYADGNDKDNSGEDDQDDYNNDDKDGEDDAANVPESHQLSLWLS